MKLKLYTNKAWLERQLYVNRLKPEEIADKCDVSHQTIYNWINKFGLRT